MNIIVGTAGHIDHGKTSLIKALTGIDADRLPEEKQRGITIDLGFAELQLGELRIGFVDVPGHERFVKNMLAGASGIDLVLLIIAANEGVMPQTREHFEICRLLAIRTGLVVITKTDLADAELLDLVRLEIAELVDNSFLHDAPVIVVSARSGDGIHELKQALREAAAKASNKSNELITRLPIDRSFTVKGFGTVVTGTLASGQINLSDELEMLPIGRKVRVRGAQIHGQDAKAVSAGMRTALNLSGIEHNEISRGMILTEKGVLRPMQIIDTEIEILKDAKKALKTRQRVRVHIGTVEALARVMVLNDKSEIVQGEKDFAQIRLEVPVAAVPGERLILRSYSPQMTIGGGQVLDALAQKHRKKDIGSVVKFLRKLSDAPDSATKIQLLAEEAGENALNFADLQARTGLQKEILQNAIAENIGRGSLVEANGYYISRRRFEGLTTRCISEIESCHVRHPLLKGILRESLREKIFPYVPEEIFKAVINELKKTGKILIEKDTISIAGHSLELTPGEAALRESLASIYKRAGMAVPTLEDALNEAARDSELGREQTRKIFQLLLNADEIVKISEEFYFSGTAIEDLKDKMQEFASRTAERLIDVPKFKEIAGVSRKYAIPLLEYFDREKITRRAGDKRLIL
ncbi:MAG: selenocysteine-specific translation elongation factor [Acidobacteriota bacterium]|nr:selenocysteine-specific translation elongation factor [Acidobacteriota bacterium]